jgi:urate oxidase
MGIVLGANQYGKAENRVVRVVRDTPRHRIVDRNVSTALRGDFTAAHTAGDQSAVLPTDTQKNTAFAYALEYGPKPPEDYATALGRRLLEATPAARSAQIRVEEYPWDRIDVDIDGNVGQAGHDHAFVRRGGDVRTCIVTVTRTDVAVIGGLHDLVLLKSTGSEFRGFLTDEFTTLPETDDRILATSLVARWRYQETPADWDVAHDSIRTVLLRTFATTYSRALQETLHLMGTAALEQHPELAEIRFSAPNRHHFEVDLERFGLTNAGEVFIAADRPYGLIEATLTRDDATDAGEAWLAVPGFC